MRSLFWIVCFVIIGLLNIGSVVFESDIIFRFTKPILMPTLMAFVYFSFQKSKISSLLLVALLFAWLGDIFLLINSLGYGMSYFLIGLFSFLICHIIYINLFRLLKTKEKFKGGNIWIIIPIFMFILYSYLKILWYNLDDFMRIPVVIYGLVITTMVIYALDLIGRLARRVSYVIAAGAIIFLISDMLIGINRFGGIHDDKIDYGAWIMFTYILGQFLIVFGMRKEIGSHHD
jgi:uncharacterized membrane protein YhhN